MAGGSKDRATEATPNVREAPVQEPPRRGTATRRNESLAMTSLGGEPREDPQEAHRGGSSPGAREETDRKARRGADDAFAGIEDA